jgi:uncharacterized protein (TIGR02271 family)
MTMHADQLVGAQVTDSDGLAVGTIEQVFRDDVDGTPSWARIRSAKGLHFVPLAGSKMTSRGGLCVPFDSRKILGEPDISVDRHMSVDQEEQLRRYFGIRVPAQPTYPEVQARQAQRAREARTGEGLTERAQAEQPQAEQPVAEQPVAEQPVAEQPVAEQPVAEQPVAEQPVAEQPQAEQPQAEQPQAEQPQAEQPRAEHDESGNEWLVRSEERIAVNLETRESGRVTMRKYVDAEQVQQTVRVFHEELEIERVPIGGDDQITGDMAECEQEIILHEARAKITKETVPVERVRLSVRKVEEDKTVSGELRKERIEVIDDGSATEPPRR